MPTDAAGFLSTARPSDPGENTLVGDEQTATLLEAFLTRMHKAVTIAKRVVIGDLVVDARIIEATADAAAWYGLDDPKLLIGQWISLLHHPEDATLGRTLSVARHYGIKVPTRYVSRIRQVTTPQTFRPVLKDTTQIAIGSDTYWVTVLAQPNAPPLAQQMHVCAHFQLPPPEDVIHFCGHLSVAEMQTLLRTHPSIGALESPLSQISDKKESQKLPKTAQAPSNDSGPRPPLTLTPGQTYLMPTGRYVHWCTVCGNLWRSGEPLPVYCGHRACHSPRWRTGTSAREG
jgi:hypothetical protein